MPTKSTEQLDNSHDTEPIATNALVPIDKYENEDEGVIAEQELDSEPEAQNHTEGNSDDDEIAPVANDITSKEDLELGDTDGRVVETPNSLIEQSGDDVMPDADEEFGGFNDTVRNVEPVSNKQLRSDSSIPIDPDPNPKSPVKDVSGDETIPIPLKDLNPVRRPSRGKKVSFSEISQADAETKQKVVKGRKVEKENSNNKNSKSNHVTTRDRLKAPQNAINHENPDAMPQPSIDSNKLIVKALENVLKDKSGMKTNISNFTVDKSNETPNPKPANLQDRLKLFVTKKSNPNPNPNDSNTTKRDTPLEISRNELKSVNRQKLNSSYHLPFDEMSYLEQQLKMAEVDRMRLKADLYTVEESIAILKANITKAKNLRTLTETTHSVNLNESSVLITKLDRLRKEQQERTLRIKLKTQADQEGILKQLEEQNKERVERYSRDKRAKLAESIDRIKNRADSRKKQLLGANKVIKTLMEPDDPTVAYLRYRGDRLKTLDPSLHYKQ